MLIIAKLYAFLLRDWRLARSYRMNFFFDIVQTLTLFLSFFFIGKLILPQAAVRGAVIGGNYFRYVFLGIAFSAYMTAALGSVSDAIGFERGYGTLEAILVTPTSFPTIAVAKALWEMALVTVKVGFYLLLGVFVFKTDLSHARWIPTVLTLGLTIGTFLGIGLFSAGLQLLTREGNPLDSFLGWTSRFLGGAYFPTSVLPLWLTKVSAWLPLTYTLAAVRKSLIAGEGVNAIRPELAVLAAFAIVFLPLGALFFGWSFKQARHQGQLGMT